MSEIEDVGLDKWRVFINRWSQTLLTVSGFWRLKSQEPCIRIYEVVKFETLNRRKVSLEAKLF
jgi:hypothetical protein